MTAKTLSRKACTCSLVVAVDTDGNVTTTGCTATTKRTFAPGHDARLKGFLIRAGIQEQLLQVGADADNQTAQQVAEQFGFGYMVAAGIKNGQAKLMAKLLRQVSKGAKVAVVAKPAKVTAKVGRWTYEGEILAAGDGTPVFRYTDKRGNVIDTMKFTQI